MTDCIRFARLLLEPLHGSHRRLAVTTLAQPAHGGAGPGPSGMIRKVQGAQRGIVADRDTNLTVGGFRFWFVGQRWEWSDELARMHGYEPGSVVPTTALLLSHKHPDDRAHVQDLLDRALHSGGSFSSRHRFIDTAGVVHDAMVVADRMLDETGAVVGTAGYYVDLTNTFDETRREVLDEALPDVVEARAVIEQAKGVLMAVYRVGAEQAFGVLRWRSQETNVKLRALAKQLVAEVATLPPPSPDVQGEFDHLLLRVHERIPAE